MKEPPVKVKIIYQILGFVIAVVLGIGAFIGVLMHDAKHPMMTHEQVTPSGKKMQIASFHLVWAWSTAIAMRARTVSCLSIFHLFLMRTRRRGTRRLWKCSN